MIFFIILFIFVFIGGFGFAAYKIMSKDIQKNTQKFSTMASSKNTQSFLPFDRILDYVIDLGGNNYRQIIDVSSVNYYLRTPMEKQKIEANFQSLLNSLEFPFSWHIQTSEIDNKDMLETLRKDIDLVANDFPHLREAGENYLNDMKNITKTLNNSKIKRKYLIIPYQTPKELLSLDQKEILQDMYNQFSIRSGMVIEGLRRMEVNGKVLNKKEMITTLYSTLTRDDYSDAEYIGKGFYEEPIVQGILFDFDKNTYVIDNQLSNMDEISRMDYLLSNLETQVNKEILIKGEKLDELTMKKAKKVLEILGKTKEMVNKQFS